MTVRYGAMAPGRLARIVLGVTTHLPNNWLGLRLAIGFRRLVMKSHSGDFGLDVERWGIRLRLHPRSNGCEKGLLFTPQMYEVLERAELAAEIDRAKSAGRSFCFVDIGANVGLFSFFVASYAGSRAKILAIEPEPLSLSRMQFNLEANPHVPVQVIGLALGEDAGLVSLQVHRGDRGGTRTVSLNEDNCANAIQCQPLLQVVAQQQLQHIDALKIDVEGSEDKILVPFFLSAPKPLWPNLLIIEDTCHLWMIDLYSFLGERGYQIDSRNKQNVIMRRMKE